MRRQAGHLLALGAVLGGMLLAGHPCTLALDPSLDIIQYAHTSWRNREGFSKGAIFSIAQTPDGYLWLGTESGLLRFDGVRAVPWQPPSGQHLPSNSVPALLSTRDGTLWIGTIKGLASWKAGKLTQYPQLAGLLVNALVEDHEGTVWAGGFAYVAPGKLCAFHSGTVRCYGEDSSLGNGVLGLYEDAKGRLWAGVLNGFWLWKSGPSQFYPLVGEPNGIQNFSEDRDGTLLIPIGGRVAGLTNGKIKMAYPYPVAQRQVHGEHILRDHDGGVWVGTLNQGLVHVHEGGTDRFAQSDGLSGDLVTAILEDREGSIWVSTTKGLDRFSAYSVSTFSERQGMSSGPDASVAAARDGSIWFSARSRLGRWNKGRVTIYREPGIGTESIPEAGAGRVRELTVNGLPTHDLAALFQDDDGRIWVAANGGVGYFQNDHFVPVNDAPGGVVYAIAGDEKGNLWISNFDRGLLHLFRSRLIQQIPWAALGRKDIVTALAADRSQGGMWLGFSKGGIEYLKDGQLSVSYTAAAGLGEGRINNIQFDHDGVLWAATDGGLSRLKDGRIATLTMKQGLPCDKFFWLAEDSDLSLWLFGSCGLVRIARSELDAWAGDTKGHPSQVVKTTLLDRSDGVSMEDENSSALPSKSPDGKIWFPVIEGLSVFDPSRLHFNQIPPPVHIEQIIADRKTYDPDPDSNARVRLPSRLRDLQIDYTALSFVAPEKVLFRYKLEGWDRDWQDVGTRRQAFYSSLPPRTYRFRVMACNNSGVWNEAGTFLDFSISPAYYQTIWFRVSCVAAFLVLLGGFYRLRIQQLRQQFAIGLEARVNERTRIARALHDTLLQSFQGLMLHFQTGIDLLPGRPAEARKTLETALDRADQAIAEGRDAVEGLRASTVETNDLAPAVRSLGEELRAEGTNPNSALFDMEVEGTPRNLHPILRDEVYRIAGEALRNAFRHAWAQQIEVEILYEERSLRLRVRDDGKGIDPKLLSGDGLAGHYGLHGMRERAKLVGGKLTVWSKLDSGTEVELSIPASTAYAKPARHRSWLSEKLSGKRTDFTETDVKETNTKS